MAITLGKNTDSKNFSGITVKSALSTDEAYKLCIKADALRLANMFQESIPKYLRSIFAILLLLIAGPKPPLCKA